LLLAASVSRTEAATLETLDSPPTETIPAVCFDLHGFPWTVKRWCPPVVDHFGADWVHAILHLIDCESRGDPDANRNRPGRSHKGLLQQSTRYWPARAARAGIPGGDIYDPDTHLAVSAYLFADGRGKSHWTCFPEARHAAP
jgi:hypothetical protein